MVKMFEEPEMSHDWAIDESPIKVREIGAIYEEWLNFGYINDDEVLILKDHFSEIAEKCYMLGPNFYLAYIEAVHQYERLFDECTRRNLFS